MVFAICFYEYDQCHFADSFYKVYILSLLQTDKLLTNIIVVNIFLLIYILLYVKVIPCMINI